MKDSATVLATTTRVAADRCSVDKKGLLCVPKHSNAIFDTAARVMSSGEGGGRLEVAARQIVPQILRRLDLLQEKVVQR